MQAKIDAAQADIDHLSEVQTAIRAELEGSERWIARLNNEKHQVVAACIVVASKFTGLLDAIDKAWTHLSHTCRSQSASGSI